MHDHEIKLNRLKEKSSQKKHNSSDWKVETFVKEPLFFSSVSNAWEDKAVKDFYLNSNFSEKWLVKKQGVNKIHF